MNVSLTPKFEGFVRSMVSAGPYRNCSEVVQEALRLFMEAEHVRSARPAPTLEEIRARIVALEEPLRECKVTALHLFGSVARGEAASDSDMDILVDLDHVAGAGLRDYMAVKRILECEFGRPIDVVERDALRPAVCEQIFREQVRVF